MEYEYKIILPDSITDERLVGETVNSILAELSADNVDTAEIRLGMNYEDLVWKEGTPLELPGTLAVIRTLPGGGILGCFNNEAERPSYYWITSKDFEPGS